MAEGMGMLSKERIGDHELSLGGLGRINVIVGRNGTGKSRFLRRLAAILDGDKQHSVRYVSPERGGSFKRESGIEDAMQDANWLSSSRNRNQVSNFKAASAVLLRDLELTWLRRLQYETGPRPRLFADEVLSKLNNLLANVQLTQDGPNFVFRLPSGKPIQADQLSSGESETVALASEILHFFGQLDPERFNVLLLDEPDVHLHPDLQAGLARLLISEVRGLKEDLAKCTAVCITTHSTPLVCELSTYEGTRVGTKEFDVEHLVLRTVPKTIMQVAPFFGHPLSRAIADEVLLIVEGEDDAQVWQQAARSSQGRLRFFPCIADSVDQQTQLEAFSADVLLSIYDDPIAFSIRDGDGVREGLDDNDPVRRLRLQCYELENLLLSDDGLKVMECDWDSFRTKADAWCKANEKHEDVALVRALAHSKDRLRDTKLKAIRNLIPHIAGSTKPWHTVVGKALAEASKQPNVAPENSLADFFGDRFAELVEDTKS